MLLMIVLLKKQVFTLTCGYENLSDTRTENEGVFTKISHMTNTSGDSNFTITFELCEYNHLSNGCKFVWKSEVREPTVRSLRTRNETRCSWEHLILSEHMDVFQLHISQLVTRAISVMKLSIIKIGFREEVLRVIHLSVSYPPKVTSLSVDGKEVTDTHFIQEGLKTNITCSFDKGNPPAIFRFRDKNGKEFAKSEDHLSHTISIQCQDEWPTVHCEGSRSEENKSVSFLVKCPPRFLDLSRKIVDTAMVEATPFRVQAYMATHNGCFLISMTENNNNSREVNCTLSGNPPGLHLKLQLGKEISMGHGDWMLVLQTEEGSANTTLSFIESSRDNKNSNGSSNSTILIIAGAGAGALVLIIPCIIIIVVKTKNKSRSVKVRKVESTTGNEGNRDEEVRVNEENNTNEEATGVRQSARKSESGGSTHAPEAGVGSGTESSSTRSSSSGSDKTPSHPNYDSTAMQQVELHTYKNLPIKTSGYTTPTPKKESHSYLKLRTSKAQQEAQNPPIAEVQNSDIYDTPYQTRESLQGSSVTDAPPPPDKEATTNEGYETPPPPEKGTPPEEAYANQGQLCQVIEGDEVSYYNTA